jgi:phage gp36-like protein
LPTSYPTQAALVAAYGAAREAEVEAKAKAEAEAKTKEQEALNDAYQKFRQANQ